MERIGHGNRKGRAICLGYAKHSRGKDSGSSQLTIMRLQ